MKVILVVLVFLAAIVVIRGCLKKRANPNLPSEGGFLSTLADAAERLNAGAQRLQHDISIHVDKQQAMSSLEMVLYTERALFNSCMKTARFKVETNRKLRNDPALKLEFDKLKERYDRVESEIEAKLERLDRDDREPIRLMHPEYDIPLGGLSSEVADKVRDGVANLKSERESYLKDVLRQLDRDPELKVEFMEALDRHSARQHYQEVCRQFAG